MTARLVDINEAATYLGISMWTLRALVGNGHLVPVRLPSVRTPGVDGRRLLFDVRDLDAFIEAQKRQNGKGDPEAAAAALTTMRKRSRKREAVR